MKQEEEMFLKIDKYFSMSWKLPHVPTMLAMKLFLLEYKYKLKSNLQVQAMKTRFFKELRKSSFNKNLLYRNVEYAVRLAEHPGELMYEEMCKLMSLCDNIFALEYLGFEFDKPLKLKFESSIANKLNKEKKIAKYAKETMVEEWSKDFWWYKN